MGNVGNWVQGGIVACIGLAGLFAASHSNETKLYEIGLIIAGAAALYIFHLIKSSFDEAQH